MSTTKPHSRFSRWSLADFFTVQIAIAPWLVMAALQSRGRGLEGISSEKLVPLLVWFLITLGVATAAHFTCVHLPRPRLLLVPLTGATFLLLFAGYGVYDSWKYGTPWEFQWLIPLAEGPVYYLLHRPSSQHFWLFFLPSIALWGLGSFLRPTLVSALIVSTGTLFWIFFGFLSQAPHN